MEATVFLFFKGVKIHQTKAKDSEIKPNPMNLDKISKNFAVDNLKKTVDWMDVYIIFSVDYNAVDISDIMDTHK